MIKNLFSILIVQNVGDAIAASADTNQFINSTGVEFQTQVNLIPQIKSNLDDVNDQILVPVTQKNQEFLQALRDTQAVIDGNSQIDQLLSLNGQFLSNLSQERIPSAVDSMKAILSAAKQDLISKQARIRTDLESDMDSFFTKMNLEILPNFTAGIVNMTSDSLRNVSRSIRAIEQYRNQTYGNNVSDIDPAKVFAFAPRQSKDLMSLRNSFSEDVADLTALETQIVPASISLVNTTVRDMIRNGSIDVANTLISSELESEKIINATAVGNVANLDSLLNSTMIELSSQVATQVNAINQQLGEINSTIFAYSNLEVRTANLLKTFVDQLAAVERAKNISLVSNVFPITHGLGAGLATAAQDVSSSFSKFLSDMETVRSDMTKTIDQKRKDSFATYTHQFESLYSDMFKVVETNMTNLVSEATRFVESVQSSLESQVAEMIPQSESVSASLTHLMEQTSELLLTAQQLLAAKLQSVMEKNTGVFQQANATLTNRVASLNSATDQMHALFNNLTSDLSQFFASKLDSFDSDNQKTISNLTSSFQDAVASFQASLVPWPTVDTDALNSRVSSIDSATNNMGLTLGDLKNEIDALKTGFGLNTSGIPQAWAHDSSILSNLTSSWNQEFETAKSGLRSEIASTVNATKDRSDYVGREISGLIQTVTDQFANMQSNVNAGIAAGPEPPTIAEIQSISNDVATSVQSSRDRFFDLISQLKNEYSQNVSTDATTFRTFVDTYLGNVVNGYESAIVANMSGSSLSNKIALLMTQLSNDITYSSDLSGFKSAMQNVATNLASIDSVLDDKAAALTTDTSALDSLLNVTIVPGIQTALGSAVSLADTIVNKTGPSKIKQFVDSMNLQIDTVVNSTKKSILGNLNGQFGNTVGSLSDYIDYVSGGARQVGSQLSFIEHETKAAAIELHNISRTNYEVIKDAEKSEEFEKMKNREGMNRLLNEAKKLETNEHQLDESSSKLFEELHAENLQRDAVFVSNLTRLSEEVMTRVTNLTKSDIVSNLERGLDSEIRESRQRDGERIKRLRAESEGVGADLEKSAAVPLLEEVGGVDKSVSILVNQFHDVLSAVARNMPDSGVLIERKQKEKLLATLESLDQLLVKVSESVPAEVKKESEQALGYMHETLEDLNGVIAANKFPEVSSDRSVQIMLRDRVPGIENSIKRSRNSIKETVKFVKSNKDFSDDFKLMRKKIQALKDKRRFREDQVDRIHRFFAEQVNA